MKQAARFWAGLDLFVTGLLALPPTARPLLDVIHAVSGVPMPVFEPVQWFFVSLAGALGVLWAVVRLRDPRRDLVVADAIARVWVAGLIGWFVVAGSAPVALLAFVATELGGSAHVALALRRGDGAAA